MYNFGNILCIYVKVLVLDYNDVVDDWLYIIFFFFKNDLSSYFLFYMINDKINS